MLLISKIDESNTHCDAGFMTMAGFTGRVDQWERFDRRWRKGLRRAGLSYFHTKEHSRNQPFLAKAIKIPDDNLMFGFVVRLDSRDYEEAYRAGSWGGTAQPDSMYGLCFRYCLAMVLEVATHEYGKDLKLDFVIDQGHVNAGAPNEIVHRIKKQKIKDAAEYLGTVTPMAVEDCYGLQAADGLATGAMWEEATRTIPLLDVTGAGLLSDLKGRSLMKAPIFRCHIDREEAAKARDNVLRWADFRREFGRRRSAERLARKQQQTADPSSSSEERTL
jgi:hypothetical protein